MLWMGILHLPPMHLGRMIIYLPNTSREKVFAAP